MPGLWDTMHAWITETEGGTQTLVPVMEPLELEATSLPARIEDRYRRQRLLGRGGIGEVWEVWDERFDRAVAMKVLYGSWTRGARRRFEEEAKVSAQLQHPGVVAVHDTGVLDDGRAWFTMKVVEGETLSSLIGAVHRGQGEWTFRRLIGAFKQVCETVAFAHAFGVVHRDLKPDNIMVGAFGQVSVLDWGLAKRLEGPENLKPGAVAGTPLYMAPEQARGESVGTAADVYSLGASLYHLLTDRPPRSARTALMLVHEVGHEEVTLQPPSALDGPSDRALDDVVLRALAFDATARFPTAEGMTTALAAWLDGSERRERALAVVADADLARAEAVALRSQAEAERQKGTAALALIAAWAPESEKREAWADLDLADEVEGAAERREAEADQLLHTALRIDPELTEAHEQVVRSAWARHGDAEARRNKNDVTWYELLLATHLDALPAFHPLVEEVRAYLRGTGRLQLQSDPPGASAVLIRQVVRDRRLVDEAIGPMGRLPLDVPLEMGSYVVALHHPGQQLVRYPVHIGRCQTWVADRVWLPAEGAVSEHEVYVPAGPFIHGGDAEVDHPVPQSIQWCAGFVIQKLHVSNQDFVTFLNALVDAGQEEEAERFAPRYRTTGARTEGAGLFGRTDQGHFALGIDSEGHPWLPDVPVVMVDAICVQGYLGWLCEKAGLPWRLPTEREFEKASRGVDGRWFPWGDQVDPAWCCMADSHRGERRPVAGGSFEADRSVYGVADLAGNVYDVCDRSEPGAAEGKFLICGGGWSTGLGRCRCASRRLIEDHQASTVGFRAARSLPE